MSAAGRAHYETAPDDRILFAHKVIYGLGGLVNNLLAAAIGGMVIVLNLGLGMDPALVGLMAALARLSDAFIDPLMGYISDHTRSRWGRRRPYILVGAITSGLIYALLWQLPEGRSPSFYFWFFLIGSMLFYLAYTVFAAPWVALGYELTPDYHERSRLMGVQNFVSQLAYVISPWFLAIMQYRPLFDDMVAGAAGLAIAVGVVTAGIGVLPAIFLRERFGAEPGSQAGPALDSGSAAHPLLHSMADFLKGFVATVRFRPFLKLCAATFLVFNGFILVSAFQSYVIIYYVCGGDKVKGAEYVGYTGSLAAISTFLVIIFVTRLATAIGKRQAFFVSIGISMVGYALKWFCYDPHMPWLILLPMPLLAFALGGLFTVVPAMMPDVVDFDELQTAQRREGMYGSIFWWVVKLGMAAAIFIGGLLLNATGFDVALEGAQTEQTLLWMRIFDIAIPIIASAIAIWAIASYEITEGRAHEVRAELERRRAALRAAAAV